MGDKMKKIFAMVLSVLLIVGCLSSCGETAVSNGDTATDVTQKETENETEVAAESETQSTESTLEPATITFWYTYGDAEEEVLLNTVIPMWNELHPEITVECVRQDSSQYSEMIVISFGTGDGPDVARIDISNTAAYAAQGGLTALSQNADFAELSSNYLEGPLSTNLYQGEYYGLPLDTNCKAAVFNTTLLKSELGLDAVPATMEELIEAAKDRGSYSISVSGFGDWDLYPYFWLFGGTLTDDGFTTATGYLDSDASVKAVEKLVELHEQKILTIKELDGSVDAWDGIESEYAMFLEGPWYGFADKADLGIVAAAVPTYEGRSASVVGGENIAVFATSEYQEASYEFAKFMTTEEVQLAMLSSGQLPVLNTLSENTLVKDNPIWAVYMQQLESAKARIPSPNNADIETIWKDAMTNIFMNDGDIKTQLQSAAALIDEKLK